VGEVCHPTGERRRIYHLPLAPLAPCALIIVGVVTIGWRAMPGGDLHNGVSLWLAFLLFSPSASIRRNGQTERFFDKVSYPSD